MQISSDPKTVTLVGFSKMMQYVKYIGIPLPQKLHDLVNSKSRSALSIRSGIKMPTSWRLQFKDRPIPLAFSQYGLASSFLVNYWNSIITICLALALFAFLYVIKKIADRRSSKTFKNVMEILHIIFGWNIVMIIIAIDIDSIILYASLELRSLNTNYKVTPAFVASIMMCFLFVFLTIAIPTASVLLTRMYRKRKTQVCPAPCPRCSHHRAHIIHFFEEEWKNFRVCFRGFKMSHAFKAYFFTTTIARFALSMIIVPFAYTSPLAVCIYEVSLNIVFLVYTAALRPFEKVASFIQVIMFEGLSAVMNICMLVIVILHESGSKNDKLKDQMGEIIFVGHILLSFYYFGFLCIKVVLETVRIFKHRHKSKYGTVGLLQLIALPIQQANMGFEEFMEDTSTLEKEMERSDTQNLTTTTTSHRDLLKNVSTLENQPLPTLNNITFNNFSPMTAVDGNDDNKSGFESPARLVDLESPAVAVKLTIRQLAVQRRKVFPEKTANLSEISRRQAE